MIYRIKNWRPLAALRWFITFRRLRRHTDDIKKKVCELTGLTDHEVFVSIEKDGAIEITLYPDAPLNSLYMCLEYDHDELNRWIKETYDLT